MFSRGNEVANRTNLLRCMSPELALFGHDAKSDLSALSGAKRKCDFGAVRSPFDPKRTRQALLYASHSGRWPRTPPLHRAQPKLIYENCLFCVSGFVGSTRPAYHSRNRSPIAARAHLQPEAIDMKLGRLGVWYSTDKLDGSQLRDFVRTVENNVLEPVVSRITGL
jgi:hypothetical protein